MAWTRVCVQHADVQCLDTQPDERFDGALASRSCLLYVNFWSVRVIKSSFHYE